jgi:hypothetical protein
MSDLNNPFSSIISEPLAPTPNPTPNPILDNPILDFTTTATNNTSPLMETPPTETPLFGNFTPNTSAELLPSQIELLDLSPAKFDQLTKILGLLQDQGVIAINNSIICQGLLGGTTILKCDISQISPNIELHISSPKKYVRLFKFIKGTGNIKIIDDDEQKRYIIINNEMKILLPKQLDSVIDNLTPPDLSGVQLIGKPIKITKDLADSFKNFKSGTDHIEILIKNNNICSVYFPETAIINFPDVKENVDETSADLILKSFNFLTVDSDEYDICIGKQNNDHWMLTSSKIGIIDVFLMEKLEEESHENLLI